MGFAALPRRASWHPRYPRPAVAGPAPVSASARICLWLAVAGLLVLHVIPPHRGAEPVLLGFLPWDLGYHVLWMVGAALTIIFAAEVVWREPPEAR